MQKLEPPLGNELPENSRLTVSDEAALDVDAQKLLPAVATQPVDSGHAGPTIPAAQQSAAATREAVEPSHFWLTRGDQLFVGAMCTLGLCLLVAYWMQMYAVGGRPLEIDRLPESRFEYRVDINRATWVEWAQLDGIGETLAHRIVEDRERRGPFRSIEDVSRVKGIGPKKMDQVRPWLEIGESKVSGGAQ